MTPEELLDLKITEGLDQLKDTLAEETPVRTGKLRSGWMIEGNSIVNRVGYLVFVNARQKFVQRAIDRFLRSRT